MTELPRRRFAGTDERRGDAAATGFDRNEHAGEPRIARIALEIVKDERRRADQRIGRIERDEYAGDAVDVEAGPDAALPLGQRRGGIEMTPLGIAPGDDPTDEVGSFGQGNDLQATQRP